MKNSILLVTVFFAIQLSFGQSEGTKRLQADQKAEVAKLVSKQSGEINKLKADRDSKLAPIIAAEEKVKTTYYKKLLDFTRVYGENSANVKELKKEFKTKITAFSNQKKLINTSYNTQAKAITSKQVAKQTKLINRQGKETAIANKRDAAERQNAQKAKNAMLNISRKTDAQNAANNEAKTKLLTKQSQERKALIDNNAKREGAIVRSQQDKLLQKNNDHNKDFTRRMNDPNGKSVPVKDMPSIANSVESQKSFKKTNKLIKDNAKTLAKEKKQLAKSQKTEQAQLNKKIKKANSTVKKKNSSTIKKAGKSLKEKAKKINEKANKAVKKVRKGRKG